MPSAKKSHTTINNIPTVLIERYKHVIGEQQGEEFSFEQVLENIVNYYEKIIDCMPGNVYWLDKNGVTLGCNRNVLKMFGLKSLEEFKGLSFEDMGRLAHWSKAAEQSFKRDTLEVVQTGKPKLNVEEPPIPYPDGRTIYFLTSRVPLFDQVGNIIGVVGISIDITDRKKMEESLLKAKEAAEAANKAKTEFLENMRHDIRTPLSGIIGCTTLIKENIDNPAKIAEVKEYVDNALASSNTLLALLNNVLQSVKIASGEMPQQKRKFDLKETLQKIVELNKAKADQKKLKLTLEYDESIPPYLVGDNDRIFYVILELVVNALKFTNEGYVKISTLLAKDEENAAVIKIIVQDSGIGIPLEQQDEIFIRFKRLTPAYMGVHEGLGLGLSNIKQFIDDVGGEIYVESVPQKGTTFTCVIRLVKALLGEEFGASQILAQPPKLELLSPQQAITTINPINTNTAPGNLVELIQVLVVEDQPLAAKVAASILKDLGCSIAIAENGQSAINCVKNKNYDLILMDVGLPDMSGNEVTKQIREWELLSGGKYTPIIALTAHAESEEKQNCIKSGMDAVFSKPLIKEVALNILNAFVPKQVDVEQEIKENEDGEIQKLFNLPEATIDYDKAVKLAGGQKEIAKDLVQMLVNSLPQELTDLQYAHKSNDWKTIQAITHKLKGATCYCGADRLTVACGNFEAYLRSGKTELAEQLYEQLLQEIEKVKAMSSVLLSSLIP